MRRSYLLNLRRELAALKARHESAFDCREQVELDAVDHGVIWMTELIYTIKQIVSAKLRADVKNHELHAPLLLHALNIQYHAISKGAHFWGKL